MRRPIGSRAFAWLMLLGGALAGAASALPAARQMAFEEVIANLRVGDPRVRMDALTLLREAGYLEAAPAVAPLLSDAVPEVQARAIETEVGLFLVDEAYTREYGKSVVKARGASLPLLAFAQGQGATVPNPTPSVVLRGLVAAAASPALPTRFDAAYAIGVLGPSAVKRGQFPDAKAAIDRLMTLVREPDATMRLAATHVLGRLMEAALANPSANTDLMAMRAEVGDQIVAGMNDPDEMIRLSSMGVLGQMRHDRAVQALSDTVGYYKRDKFGMAALDALARIAHPGSLTVFSALLENGDAQVRRLSVEGIGRSGDQSALANLAVRTAREKSDLVLQAIAFARAKNRDDSQVARIVEGFRNWTLRDYAFDYLVELGPALAPSLAGYATHKDAAIRLRVAEVLGVMGNPASLPAIDVLARDKDKQVASAAERSRRRLVPRPPAQSREP